MSTILGLRTTIYKVSDLEKATKWYTKVFNQDPYFLEDFYVGYNIGGYELGLLPEENTLEKELKTANVLSYWGVEDIQKTFHLFIDEGAIEHEAPHNVGGEIIVASVTDLWGNTIGFIYNPHFLVKKELKAD